MDSDYKQAYLTLFNAVSDAVEALKMRNYGVAEATLVLAQAQAEEDFLRAGDQREQRSLESQEKKEETQKGVSR